MGLWLLGLVFLLCQPSNGTPVSAEDEERSALSALEHRASLLTKNRVSVPLSMILDLAKLDFHVRNHSRELELVGLGRLSEPVPTTNWIRLWTLGLIDGEEFQLDKFLPEPLDESSKAQMRSLLHRPVLKSRVHEAWPAIAALPPIEQMGYMFQQFLDGTGGLTSSTIDNFYQRFLMMTDGFVATLEPRIKLALKEMIYDFEPGDVAPAEDQVVEQQITACHFVREQLKSKHLITEKQLDFARRVWETPRLNAAKVQVPQGSFEHFKLTFLAKSATEPSNLPEHIFKILFAIYALNSHLKPDLATILTPCEWSLAIAFTPTNPTETAHALNPNWMVLPPTDRKRDVCDTHTYCDSDYHCCTIGTEPRCCVSPGAEGAMPIGHGSVLRLQTLNRCPGATDYCPVGRECCDAAGPKCCAASQQPIDRVTQGGSVEDGEYLLGSFELAPPAIINYNYASMRRLLRGISIVKTISQNEHQGLVVDMGKLKDTHTNVAVDIETLNFQEQLFRSIAGCPSGDITECPGITAEKLTNFFTRWASDDAPKRTSSFMLAHHIGQGPYSITWKTFIAALSRGTPLFVPGFQETDLTKLWTPPLSSEFGSDRTDVAHFFAFWGCACKFLELYEVYHDQTSKKSTTAVGIADGSMKLTEMIPVQPVDSATLVSISEILRRFGYKVTRKDEPIRMSQFVHMCLKAEQKPRLQVLLGAATLKSSQQIVVDQPLVLLLKNIGNKNLEIERLEGCHGTTCTDLKVSTVSIVNGYSIHVPGIEREPELSRGESLRVQVSLAPDRKVDDVQSDQVDTIMVTTNDPTLKEFRIVLSNSFVSQSETSTVSGLSVVVESCVVTQSRAASEPCSNAEKTLQPGQGFRLTGRIAAERGAGPLFYKWVRKQEHVVGESPSTHLIENAVYNEQWSRLEVTDKIRNFGPLNIEKEFPSQFDSGYYYLRVYVPPNPEGRTVTMVSNEVRVVVPPSPMFGTGLTVTTPTPLDGPLVLTMDKAEDSGKETIQNGRAFTCVATSSRSDLVDSSIEVSWRYKWNDRDVCHFRSRVAASKILPIDRFDTGKDGSINRRVECDDEVGSSQKNLQTGILYCQASAKTADGLRTVLSNSIAFPIQVERKSRA